jgi:hypothetical protein
MLSTQSLREQMDRYADGIASVDALEEWLASEAWDMRRWASPGLQHLVESIQGSLIRHADGELLSDDLHKFLLDKHEQLHRAADATSALNLRVIVEDHPVAASSSLTLQELAVAPA